MTYQTKGLWGHCRTKIGKQGTKQHWEHLVETLKNHKTGSSQPILTVYTVSWPWWSDVQASTKKHVNWTRTVLTYYDVIKNVSKNLNCLYMSVDTYKVKCKDLFLNNWNVNSPLMILVVL